MIIYNIESILTFFHAQVQAVLAYEGKTTRGNTKIGIKFDDTVSITESFYPPASIPNFMAEIGGILGLWLGVGTLQLFLHAFEIFGYIKSYIEM